MTLNHQFHVQTLSDLRSLFISNENIQPIDFIENANLIDGYDLCTYYPAQYHDEKKQALFDELIKKHKYEPSKRNVLITRFYPKQLPSVYLFEQHSDSKNTYEFLPNIFDYKSIDDNDVLQWHMNFANHDIFSYYQSSLLAQDELQYKTVQYACHSKNNQPYPMLISNIERVLELDTTNLYGNKFYSSSKSKVLKSYKYLDPHQTVNIIAIEAPKYGRGSYTIQQIIYILQACYTAYSSTKLLANITFNLNNSIKSNPTLKTYIHTGWFGCGAYGGNRTIMIILQILAAKLAGIDKLIFHTVTSDCEIEKREAIEFLTNLFGQDRTLISIDDLIEKIYQKNYQWSLSNRT